MNKMNSTNNKNQSPLVKNSVNKNDSNVKALNVELIVKNGEARIYLNNSAKAMLDDLKDFSTQSVEIFNNVNTNLTQKYHVFLKHNSEHKKKMDSLTTDNSERMRRMELLKSLREGFPNTK